MNDSRWWSYVELVAGGASLGQVAEQSGFDKSALSRWKRGDRPDPYFVVRFARAFGLPVVQALAEAGLITDEEAGMREVYVGIDQADSLELVRELEARIASIDTAENRVETMRPGLRPTRDQAARAIHRRLKLTTEQEAAAAAFDPEVAPEDDAEDERD